MEERKMRWYRIVNGVKVYTEIPIYNDYNGNTPVWTIPNNSDVWFPVPFQTRTIDGVDYSFCYGYWGRNPPNTKMKVNQVSFSAVLNQNYYFGNNRNYSIWQALYRPRWYLDGALATQTQGDIGGASSVGVSAYNAVINGVKGVMFTAPFEPPATQPQQDYNFFGTYHALWFFSDSWFDDAYSKPYDNTVWAGDEVKVGGNGNGVPDGDDVRATLSRRNMVRTHNTGINAYVISSTQLQNFTDYLWGNVSGLTALWNKFERSNFNPMGAYLSLHYIPTAFMETLQTETNPVYVRIAGQVLNGEDSTQLCTANIITNNIAVWASNKLNLYESLQYFGDYTLTSIQLSLPFCGTVNIQPSACMGLEKDGLSGLQVFYYCDAVNGNICAEVEGTDRDGHTQIIATAYGNCAYMLPRAGSTANTGAILGAIVGTVASTGMALAAYGLKSPNLAMGAAGGMLGVAKNVAVMDGETPNVSGDCSANAGWLSEKKIICQISYANPVYSKNYNKLKAIPSCCSGTVGDYAGLTMGNIETETITEATEAEKQEIVSLFHNGVYV